MNNLKGEQTISVIVPCRNESQYIEAFCDSVAAQQLPKNCHVEVILADGLSDDGTRERFIQWRDCYEQKNTLSVMKFIMIDNPGQIVSSGLNQCIAQSVGQFLVRLDVHTVYSPHYIAQCWQTWQQTQADNVGGPWRAEGKAGPSGLMQRAIAAAFQSRWVVGGALSRDLTYNGWVDSVYLGAWPRSTFDKFGNFDELLVRNQDDEHNLRINKGGGRVWQSAAIESVYYPRSRVIDVFRQYRQYGYWKPFVMHKHQQVAAWRQVVPGLLVGTWLMGLLLGLIMAFMPLKDNAWTQYLFQGVLLLWLTETVAYLLAVLLISVAIARQKGGELLRHLPLIIAAYHVGYGLGTWRGWWDVLVRRRPDPAFGQLTRGTSLTHSSSNFS